MEGRSPPQAASAAKMDQTFQTYGQTFQMIPDRVPSVRQLGQTAMRLASVAMFASIFASCQADVLTWGASRWLTKPGQHLHEDERVRMSFEYAELGTGSLITGMKKHGSVANLAWAWALSRDSVRRIYRDVRHGKTTSKQPRLPYPDRIMDRYENHKALIDIMTSKKASAAPVAHVHVCTRRHTHTPHRREESADGGFPLCFMPRPVSE